MRYDLLVIGTGPAGIQAALRARRAGKRTVVVEKRDSVGGTSVHTGTIPSKTLRQAVLDLSGFRHWGLYGSGPERRPRIPMAELRAACDRVIAAEVEFLDRLMRQRDVDLLRGVARFVGPNTVAVRSAAGEVRLEADHILLAVGSVPFHPADVAFDGRRVMDSDQVLALEELPRSLAVVGGGVIGSEYASIFSLLDVKVTLVHRGERILDFLDETILAEIGSQLAEREVEFRPDADVRKIETTEDGVRLTLSKGDPVVADALLFCAGRTGAAPLLDLEAAGLAADPRGRLAVDGDFRTAVPHIFAAGDVIGFPALASASREQGRVAACRAVGVDCRPIEKLLPYGIYTIPEISMVGLTERQARESGLEVETGLARYGDTARGQIIGDTSGLLKLVVSREDGKILGAHLLGTGAAELIHLAVMAMDHDAPYTYFLRSVMNYPTLARVFKVCAWYIWEKIGD